MSLYDLRRPSAPFKTLPLDNPVTCLQILPGGDLLVQYRGQKKFMDRLTLEGERVSGSY